MGQDEKDTTPTSGGITGPQKPTHEASSPPGNQEADQPDVDKGVDKLGQVGAGH
jgi:hypothetical protein